ncbi:MAG: 1-acyl-sn-glycerol-3-phosphate acyltransferase [Burkholderiales bacterium]|nr:1-acyl-sn-glycerol-3-phosphate acyltransferase [Burkholderiales bacterium]
MANISDIGKARTVALKAKLEPVAAERPAVTHINAVRGAHIIDDLIAERGQKLVNSWSWPLIKPFLYQILHYREAVNMADQIAPLDGASAMDYISRILNLDLDVTGLERIPKSGAFVMAINHPTGIADGIAVYDALKTVRGDMSFFANRDATRVNPGFADMMVPVEWRDEHRSHAKTKETLQLASKAFLDDRAIVIFPSGRLAMWRDDGLQERPWQPSMVSLARKYCVPVLPAHLDARNSWLFYWFANQNFTEMRDVTVFHELLNKKGKTFRLRIGPLIEHDKIASGDTHDVTDRLQHHCAKVLAQDADAEF